MAADPFSPGENVRGSFPLLLGEGLLECRGFFGRQDDALSPPVTPNLGSVSF